MATATKLTTVKLRELTEEETFASYTSWQRNLYYTLKKEENYAPYLDSTWQKHTHENPFRGFTDDGSGGKKKEAKVKQLHDMLEYITQWVPHYLENDIMKNSTSLNSVYKFIRKYYGFKQSETQFMKFSAIKREPNERPERLYQRILAHLHDNLMKKDGDLLYDGSPITKDEYMSPTVERLAVLRWMELIDEELPAYVARVFAHDLQQKSLKDLQPQIVDSLDSFLDDIQSKRVSCSRTYAPSPRGRAPSRYNPQKHLGQSKRRTNPQKFNKFPQTTCRVCKSEGRPHTNHSIASCNYISRAEKQDLVHAFQIDVDEPDDNDDDQDYTDSFQQMTFDDQE